MEESEENTGDGGHLADPENEHPFNDFGFGFGDFGLDLSQPFFKTFFGNFKSCFFGGTFDRVENIRQSTDALIGQSVENLPPGN